MKILMTGASGLIGQKIVDESLNCFLSRKSERVAKKFPFPCETFNWKDPENEFPPLEALKGVT